MKLCPFPIAIISFNRPALLTEVLRSLKNQTVSPDESRVYLFQDGAQNRFTQTAVDNSLQEECVKRFRTIFPRGHVFQSPVNLNVALNFDRAERLFFETLKADCGLFFEDDLVLSPHYLDAMLKLVDFALNEPLVGYVAAYGDHTMSLTQQRENRTKIVRMNHNWGFALTRRQWLAQQEFMSGYLAILKDANYNSRDHKKIDAYFAAFGFAHPASSQDAAKAVAGYVVGTSRLMCSVCFGHYIGKEGSNFSADYYKRHGYDKTELFDEPPAKFDLPTSAELMIWINDEQNGSRSHLRDANKKLDGLADLTVHIGALDFVENLYLSLLRRPADRTGLISWTEALKKGMSPSDVVRAFVNSREFKSKCGIATTEN